jgi:hypothetical protein
MHVTPHTSVGARLATLVGICVLGSVSAAPAQMTRDPREHARSHLGPFYLTPSVELAELGLETNVFNEPGNKTRSDVTATALPHADVWVPFGRRALITGSGTLGLVYYQTYASERSVNPDLRVRGDLRVHRVTLFASSAYASSRRQPNLEIDVRARHENRSVDAGAEAQITERFSVETGASETRITFQDDALFQDISLRETLNRRMRTGWASARYEVTPLTRVNLRAQLTQERFPFSPIRDADSLTLAPGVEFQPRALISGSASVGVRRFRGSSSQLPDFTGLVANANLSYALRGATRFRFTAIRDLAYSYSVEEPYYAIAGYGLTIVQHLGGRFDVTAGGDWQTYRYRRLALVAPAALPAAVPVQSSTVGTPNVSDIRIWSAGVGYRLWNTQRLGFGATYRERSASDLPDLTYSGLRVMLTVNTGL